MICPSGKKTVARKTCLALLVKRIFFSPDPNQIYNFAIPHPRRGAARDRHGRWERDAMDARAARDERSLRGRRSRVVLTLQCRRQGREDALASHGRRWQPSMVTGESTKDTVKTIAQGRPDDPPVPVVLPRAFCCTRTMGAVGTRPSLRPLLFRGRFALITRTFRAARTQPHVSLRRKHYSPHVVPGKPTGRANARPMTGSAATRDP